MIPHYVKASGGVGASAGHSVTDTNELALADEEAQLCEEDDRPRLMPLKCDGIQPIMKEWSWTWSLSRMRETLGKFFQI